MSSNTVAPSLARQYRCETHPQIEDPYRCGTCNYNRLQRQIDGGCAESARAVIDQANQDYESASRYWNLQQQDLTMSTSGCYDPPRNTARQATDGGPRGSGESYYRGGSVTGYRGVYPTRNISFRSPFASPRYDDFCDNVRCDNGGKGSPANLRSIYDSRILDSMATRGRRNAVSGSSDADQSTSQLPQQ